MISPELQAALAWAVLILACLVIGFRGLRAWRGRNTGCAACPKSRSGMQI